MFSNGLHSPTIPPSPKRFQRHPDPQRFLLICANRNGRPASSILLLHILRPAERVLLCRRRRQRYSSIGLPAQCALVGEDVGRCREELLRVEVPDATILSPVGGEGCRPALAETRPGTVAKVEGADLDCGAQ